jgi:AraC family transcriptional regulator, regulatory protein of adaptative response / methylated-DNA-[protein]-cysteine methyltransferase
MAKVNFESTMLHRSTIDTPLGKMVAIADEKMLFLLEFDDYQHLDWEIERLKKNAKADVADGMSDPIASISRELELYFKGKLTEFKTPVFCFGTPFQRSVWKELKKIPYGQTRSYADVAAAIGNPTGYRAVAQANGSNQLAIVIPCHRVINASGEMGGYGGGLSRKEWLLKHERR